MIEPSAVLKRSLVPLIAELSVGLRRSLLDEGPNEGTDAVAGLGPEHLSRPEEPRRALRLTRHRGVPCQRLQPEHQPGSIIDDEGCFQRLDQC